MSEAPFYLQGPYAPISEELECGELEVLGQIPESLNGEAVFVPLSETAAEDKGVLMTLVIDDASGETDFVLLDARDFEGEPLASVRLPQRVPVGFHSNWVPDPG